MWDKDFLKEDPLLEHQSKEVLWQKENNPDGRTAIKERINAADEIHLPTAKKIRKGRCRRRVKTGSELSGKQGKDEGDGEKKERNRKEKTVKMQHILCDQEVLVFCEGLHIYVPQNMISMFVAASVHARQTLDSPMFNNETHKLWYFLITK